MRNFLLGSCFGFIVGGLCASWGWSQAQSSPGNLFAPGNFNNETMLYQGMISQDTDNYLNSQRVPRYPWPQIGSGKYPCP